MGFYVATPVATWRKTYILKINIFFDIVINQVSLSKRNLRRIGGVSSPIFYVVILVMTSSRKSPSNFRENYEIY